jgi:nucleotide-binding universal stress UspA family protein
MFSNVIVGYDGSSQAQSALSLALSLAEPDARVTICCLHNIETLAKLDLGEPRLERKEAQGCAQRAREMVSSLFLVNTLVLEAVDVAATLLNAASSREADLLVLGPSRRGRRGQVALGSIAMRALHDLPCPVAIASVADRQPDRIGMESVAVGCDVVGDPGPALDVAVEVATGLGATLRVVAVADTHVALTVEHGGAIAYPAVLKARRLGAEEGLASVLSELPGSISVTGEVRMGNRTEKLMEVSDGVDLLVLGSHHYRPLRRLNGHSRSQALARGAHCPLLVVPPVVL